MSHVLKVPLFAMCWYIQQKQINVDTLECLCFNAITAMIYIETIVTTNRLEMMCMYIFQTFRLYLWFDRNAETPSPMFGMANTKFYIFFYLYFFFYAWLALNARRETKARHIIKITTEHIVKSISCDSNFNIYIVFQGRSF